MPESRIIELLFAGLIGAFTTMLGAGVAYLLSFSRDIRNRRQEIREILSVIRIELKDVLSSMERKEGMQRFTVSGLDLLKQKGLFKDFPSAIAAELMRVYGQLEELNDIIASMRNTIHGFIAAKNIENFHVSDFQNIYDPIKDDCRGRIKNILSQTERFTETGEWK